MILTDNELKEVTKIINNMYPEVKSMLNFTTPFELLVATILSAQCTDVRVNKVTAELFKHHNTAEDFAKMDVEDIEKWIKTCGLYHNKAKNIKKCSQKLIEDFKGIVPKTMKELTTLPGVGRKTANVVLSNAYEIPGIAVDTHVFRVTNRLGIVDENNVEKTEFALRERLPKDKWSLMHHQFINLGRNICKARKPLCDKCRLNKYCLYYRSNKND